MQITTTHKLARTAAFNTLLELFLLITGTGKESQETEGKGDSKRASTPRPLLYADDQQECHGTRDRNAAADSPNNYSSG